VTDQIRLLVVEDVPQVASHMRSLLQTQAQIKMLDVVAAGDRAMAAVTEYKPDVLIVDALLQGRTSGGQVAEMVRRGDPSVAIIMLTVPQNPIRESPERGIDAVLRMPFSGFELTTLVRRTYETHSAQSSRAGSLMTAVFSPKGGVGRTTIAYNLAVALSNGHKVCLVDGAMQFSDLRGLLRVPAGAPSIANLPTDRVREADLSEVVWRDPSGIEVLLAPPRVEQAEMVTTRDLEKILSMLRQVYEFVIIDTRAALADDVLAFLDAADVILELVTSDSMAIRNMLLASDAFEAIGYPREKRVLVLNRSDSTGGFTKEDIQQALGESIVHEIVSDGRLVLAANNEGVPFVTGSPDAPISVGVRRLADALIATLAARSPVLASR